jgi:hypothetical protein
VILYFKYECKRKCDIIFQIRKSPIRTSVNCFYFELTVRKWIKFSTSTLMHFSITHICKNQNKNFMPYFILFAKFAAFSGEIIPKVLFKVIAILVIYSYIYYCLLCIEEANKTGNISEYRSVLCIYIGY